VLFALTFHETVCFLLIIIIVTHLCESEKVLAFNYLDKQFIPYYTAHGRLIAALATQSTASAIAVHSSKPQANANATGFLVNNPIAAIVTTASLVSGLAGFFLTRFFDYWTDRTKARRAFASHVAQQIENNSESYFLMSNYAALLSNSLNRYVERRRIMQLQPEDPNSPTLKSDLDQFADYTAKESLFYCGFLFRIITDAFWVKGGTYFLPDEWASESITNVHNSVMNLFIINANISLKYINSAKVQQFQFYQKLDDETNRDLHEEYVKYKQWLLREEKQVKDAAAYTSAYSDLLRLEMNRLYRRKPQSDPRKAADIKRRSYMERESTPASRWHTIVEKIKRYSSLDKVTIELIRKSFEGQRIIKQEQSQLVLTEISSNTEMTKSDDLLKLGWDYYIEGEYELAADTYERAKVIAEQEYQKHRQKRNPIIYNSLGNAYATIAQRTEQKSEKDHYKSLAISMYEEALGLSSNSLLSAVFWANLGRLHYQLNDFEQAIDHYLKAVEIFPSSFNYNKLGSSQYYFQFAGYYNMIGNAWYNLKKEDHLTEAIQAYSQAIALFSSESIIHRNLGDAYLKQLNYDSAIESYNKASILVPERAKECYELANDIFDRVKELDSIHARVFYELAVRIFNQAIKLIPSNPIPNKPSVTEAAFHYGLAETYMKLEKWIDAINSYKEALKYDNKNSNYVHALVKAYEQSGKEQDSVRLVYEEAVVNLQKAIKDAGDNSNNHYTLGLIYYDMGEYEKSAAEYYRAIRLDPNNSDYYNQLGLTCRKMRRIDDAVRYYKKALSLNPKIDYTRNLGLGLQSFDRNDEAIPFLETVLRQKAKDADILISLAQAYAYKKNSDLDTAIHYLNAALEIKLDLDHTWKAYYLMGNFLYMKGTYSSAARAYEKAYEYNPNSPNILQKLEASYTDAVVGEPDSGELYFGLGRTLERKERFELPESHLKESINQGESVTIAAEKKNYRFAIEKWEKLQSLGRPVSYFKPSAVVYNNLGTAYDATNNMNKALECYQKANALEPSNFFVHYNMGSIYFRQNDYEQALTEFQQASLLNSKDPHTFYNIGNCYYRIGRYVNLALETWKEAVSLNPKFAEAFYNLGVFYYEQGDRNMAKKSWQQAVSCNESPIEARYNLASICVDENDTNAATEHLQIVQNDAHRLPQTPLDIKKLKPLGIKGVLILHVTGSRIN
jgi:tetratricopeptide (TPR) repeat protein